MTSQKTPLFETSLRSWLLGFAVLAVLPFALFSAHLLIELGQKSQSASKNSLTQQTELVARALNDRFSQALGLLTALAADDAMQSGDAENAYRLAKRLVAESSDFQAVVLVNRDESMAFITAMPFGLTPPAVSDIESARKVFTTGKPVLSRVFKSPLSGRYVVALGVPVHRGTEVVYCLRLIFLVDSLSRVIQDQGLPDDWITTTVDRDGVVVTRSFSADKYVGKPATKELIEAIKEQRQNLFERRSAEGIPVTTAVRPIGSWGWNVAISVPNDSLYGPLRGSLTQLVGVGLLLFLVVIVVALRLAQLLSQQFSTVVSAATGEHAAGRIPRLGIAELSTVHGHLVEHVERRRQTEAALVSMSAEMSAAEDRLLAARRDLLTQLYRREAFQFEFARVLEALTSGTSVALLFIDLDNFKAINDRQGHERGDEVLARVADAIRNNLRGGDLAGRLGGDEFVVAVVAQDQGIESTACALAERLIAAINRIDPDLGASIGISMTGHSVRTDVAGELRRADAAMYVAKREGKNRYSLASTRLLMDVATSGADDAKRPTGDKASAQGSTA
jgi:diguanylate cyclase (GGDEF)-like protein